MTLHQLPLQAFLEQAASDAPTPGGGAVAAVGGALAASMVSMTARLTLDRPRYAAVQEQAARLATDGDAAREALVALADADAAAYAGVVAAMRLPRGDEAERGTRSEALQAALLTATRVPLAVAVQCAAVLDLAETAADVTNHNALGDVATAALLAESAMRAAAVQAELNLAGLADRAAADALGQELAPHAAGAASRVAAVLARVRQRAGESA